MYSRCSYTQHSEIIPNEYYVMHGHTRAPTHAQRHTHTRTRTRKHTQTHTHKHTHNLSRYRSILFPGCQCVPNQKVCDPSVPVECEVIIGLRQGNTFKTHQSLGDADKM